MTPEQTTEMLQHFAEQLPTHCRDAARAIGYERCRIALEEVTRFRTVPLPALRADQWAMFAAAGLMQALLSLALENSTPERGTEGNPAPAR